MEKAYMIDAVTCGLRGDGSDQTKAFQRILQRLAGMPRPGVLRLDPSGVYMVKTLRAPHGVTIDGRGAVLQNTAHDIDGEDFMFTASGRAVFTLKNIILRAACPLRGLKRGGFSLENVALEPMPGTTAGSVRFVFSGCSVLRARRVNALYLTDPEHPAVFRDDARADWRGGAITAHGLCFLDRAGGRLVLSRMLGSPGTSARLVLGRPSGELWQALCGTAQAFKRVRGNPSHRRALAAWKKHSASQSGRLSIRAGGSAAEALEQGLHVHVNGAYRLDVRDTNFKVLRAFDVSRVRMTGGVMMRVEAYGLSDSRYRSVNLIAPGRDDPWRPSTTYLQGFHNMEFGRCYNDILPRVDFRDGLIDFAGDDCLNGLPEPRAMQLMEVVHDISSLFPSFDNLKAFAPEQFKPGARIRGLAGQAGAVHDESTRPVIPYDFRAAGFKWRGIYRPAGVYRTGDVCAYNGMLFVCNRRSRGTAPNAVFDKWQIFTVAFRNQQGYIQAARRVESGCDWQWEKRQALGPWAGYTKRERGNPIVTYHVHLVLKNVEIIRRANTWSFCVSPRVPVGNAAYDYILSSHVCNVPYNTEVNRVECENITLTNIGADAMPVRGLSVGPHRHVPSRSSFRNVRVRGASVGAPVLFRVDDEPMRRGNSVELTDVVTEGALWSGPRPRSNPFGGDARFSTMRRVESGSDFAWYDFLGKPPAGWRDIKTFIREITRKR